MPVADWDTTITTSKWYEQGPSSVDFTGATKPATGRVEAIPDGAVMGHILSDKSPSLDYRGEDQVSVDRQAK